MIFHLSMAADEPAHVAAVIAEIWGGRSFPFPPFPGSFIAMAGDDRRSAVEVYPRVTTLHAGRIEVEAWSSGTPARHGPVHAAVATPLSEAQVTAIANREGWTCRTLSRGGAFHVIEVWVENCFLLEVLPADMQAEYVSRVTIEGWEAMLAAGPPA